METPASAVNMGELGARIVALRKRLGLSQGQLARLAGISSSHLSRIERGKRKRIAGRVVVQLARALGTSSEHLLGFAEQLPMRELNVSIPERIERIVTLATELREAVAELPSEAIQLPIYAEIPLAWPDEAKQQTLGTFPFPKSSICSRRAFWLEVHGWSLRDAGIEEGDLILVDPGVRWEDGDVVAARLSSGQSLARRIRREGDRLRLEATDRGGMPMHVTKAELFGVVTTVIKDVK